MTEQQNPEGQQQSKNIFPLHVLKASQHTQIMVQLKSGQTYNGILKSIDKFMNIKLSDAILTDAKGQVFRQVGEVYVRGNVLKYFTLQEFALKKIQGTEYKAPEKFNRGDRDKKHGYKKRQMK